MASSVPMKKNTLVRIVFPIYDNDGDLVSGAAGLDSKYSLDGGSFGDCTNEATEIATSSGIYYLDLIAGETNGDVVCIKVYSSTTDSKDTVLVFYTAAQTLDEMDAIIDDIYADTDALPNNGALTDIDAGVNNIEAKLPSKDYIRGTADADGGMDTEDKADIEAECDDAITANADINNIDSGVDNIEAKLPTNYIMGSSDQTDKDDEITDIKAVTDVLPNAGALTDIDTGVNNIEAKLPSGTISDLTTAQVNSEVDDALDTAIPGVPTADSINERMATMDDNLPSDPADQSAVEAAISTAEGNIRGGSDTLDTLSGQLDTAQADLDNPSQYMADVASLALEATVTDLITRVKGLNDIHDDLVTVLGNTNELQIDWADGGRLDLLVDSVIQLLQNRLKVNVASSQLELYNDAGDSIIKTWPLTDKDGNSITAGVGTPTEREQML